MRRRKEDSAVTIGTERNSNVSGIGGATNNNHNKKEKVSILLPLLLTTFMGGFATGGLTLLTILSFTDTRPTLKFSATRLKPEKGDTLGNLLHPHATLGGWTTSLLSNKDECLIHFGTYEGIDYTVPDVTVGKPRCLIESKFLKVQQHAVRINNSTNATTSKDTNNATDEIDIIRDWIWIDYHERINVLVEAPGKPDMFIILKQTKYALEGRESYAIVGGIIEPGEEAAEAAEREIGEELGLNCTLLEFLGRYRTDVNRGMGWTNTFIASTCKQLAKDSPLRRKHLKTKNDTKISSTIVGGADTEKYTTELMSLRQIYDAVLRGKFLEIQWTATIALALLSVNFQPDIELDAGL